MARTFTPHRSIQQEARVAALTALGALFDGRTSSDEYHEMYESAVSSRNPVFAQAYKAATDAIVSVMEGK